jgi:hypothetical protein
MAQKAAVEKFSSEFFDIFDDTFNRVRGIYLDRGTSLFETLATISAEEASRPVSASCASLAAQVAHVRFYIDVLYGHMSSNPPKDVDWGEVWRTVTVVTPEEWEASKAQLRASYEKALALMKGYETWDGENDIGGALAILVHTAYHLGEIRQALCTIRQTT